MGLMGYKINISIELSSSLKHLFRRPVRVVVFHSEEHKLQVPEISAQENVQN
jgi:hypothetical protein